MALLDEIVSYLTDQTVLPITGYTAYKAWMPESPDKAIGFFETPGFGTPDALGPDWAQLGFQARVRGEQGGYDAARTVWQALFDGLHGKYWDASTGIEECPAIWATNDGPITWNDQNGRPNFTANFRILRHR